MNPFRVVGSFLLGYGIGEAFFSELYLLGGLLATAAILLILAMATEDMWV